MIGRIVERKIYFNGKFIYSFVWIRAFATARAVFHHVCSAHVKHLSDYICLWNGCDRLKRQKWSLISHIQVEFY